jgi:hypothetical protein
MDPLTGVCRCSTFHVSGGFGPSAVLGTKRGSRDIGQALIAAAAPMFSLDSSFSLHGLCRGFGISTRAERALFGPGIPFAHGSVRAHAPNERGHPVDK